MTKKSFVKKGIKSKDLELLGETIRLKVLKKFNILLEWEIKKIGY